MKLLEVVRGGQTAPDIVARAMAIGALSHYRFALVILAVLLPMWRRQVAFDGKQLRVKATYYSRQSPLSDFRLDQARVVDTREHTEFKPRLKTNGFGLPGYWAGHFMLRDKRKAFCLVTDVSKVLALPHADGRVWLLSFEHPQAVLDILRRAAA